MFLDAIVDKAGWNAVSYTLPFLVLAAIIFANIPKIAE
jgi:hypothetical protein